MYRSYWLIPYLILLSIQYHYKNNMHEKTPLKLCYSRSPLSWTPLGPENVSVTGGCQVKYIFRRANTNKLLLVMPIQTSFRPKMKALKEENMSIVSLISIHKFCKSKAFKIRDCSQWANKRRLSVLPTRGFKLSAQVQVWNALFANDFFFGLEYFAYLMKVTRIKLMRTWTISIMVGRFCLIFYVIAHRSDNASSLTVHN